MQLGSQQRNVYYIRMKTHEKAPLTWIILAQLERIRTSLVPPLVQPLSSLQRI